MAKKIIISYSAQFKDYQINFGDRIIGWIVLSRDEIFIFNREECLVNLLLKSKFTKLWKYTKEFMIFKILSTHKKYLNAACMGVDLHQLLEK